jgi:hypothetical protein
MLENENPVNKTQAIRGVLAENPDASPKRVAEVLAAQGIQVTPAFVATMKAMRKSPPQPVPEPNMPPRHISFGEGKLFYKLYAALCSYANGHLNVVQGDFSDPEQFTSLPPEIRLEVRDALYAQPELIDQFVQENPAQLSTEELAIVAGWKHAVIGDFYVFRYLKKYAVFLKAETPVKAYGVLALASPFEEVVGPHLPIMVKGVLLPINGRIIYDGLLSSYRISYGPGIRRRLNEDYKQAKETFGIITSLPEGQTQPPTAKKKAPKKKFAGSGGPGDVKAIFEVIVEMTDAFCEAYLNGEYADLCRKLAAVLARKRPSPLTRGKWETWACGIVRTVGWVNFLDDPTQTPHMKLTFIDKAFGVAESTGQGKSKTIRNLLKIRQFDPKWTLPSRLDDNPRVWMVSVNGFIMDLRFAPRELQVEAFEKGLIPYIPADRGSDSDDKE